MDAGKILVAQSQGIYIVKFVGDVRLNLCSTLDKYTDEMFVDEAFKTVIIDCLKPNVLTVPLLVSWLKSLFYIKRNMAKFRPLFQLMMILIAY